MAAIRRITILVHKNDRYPRREDQLIWILGELWKLKGMRVTVLKGLSNPPPASDLLIPHIDLTRTPPDYLDYIDQFANVINRGVTDISKRRISTNLLTADDPYKGPVIIKTNSNFGGTPERRMRLMEGGQPRTPAADSDPIESIDSLSSHNYPVLRRLQDVPPGVWRNPDLVVERFIAEREESCFAIRVCLFLGDVALARRVFSPQPIVKGSTITHAEEVEVPPELTELRRELGFDYGKFDYVVHNDRMQLLDANKTPSGVNEREANLRIAGVLAPAVLSYLDRGP